MVSKLDPATLAERARQITHVLTDCDGVLTDGTVYYSAAGEELLRFSRRDGMGVQRLREAGITCAIVTRERSPIVDRRADKLGITVHAGIDDKRTWLVAWLLAEGLHAAQIAYIGDDVNDLEVIAALQPHGVTGAPADAEPEVIGAVHFVSGRVGGAGAFREFAEFILDARGSGISTEGSKPWA